LRATAEGNVSSIVFRRGILDAKGGLTMVTPSRYGIEPSQVPSLSFEKPLIERKRVGFVRAGFVSGYFFAQYRPAKDIDRDQEELGREAVTG
jgi:hypothetical protein